MTFLGAGVVQNLILFFKREAVSAVIPDCTFVKSRMAANSRLSTLGSP